MSADRRSLFAALHVALDQLEERGADPSPIAGAAACLGDDVRAAPAAVGWAAEPLDEAALTARLAALAREAAGEWSVELERRRLDGRNRWRAIDSCGQSYSGWCDSEALAWADACFSEAERFEMARDPNDAPGEGSWARRRG